MEKELSHTLKRGNEYRINMPSLGLGVWGISRDKTEKIVTAAINYGYKHIDTAQIYENEREVGKATKGMEEIFITTKLWENNFGYEKAIRTCEESLSKLNKIDLFLMHSPHGVDIRKETWEAMQYLLKNKYVNAIGVSNFGIHHIKEIFSWAEIGPCINQIELSPFLQRRELVNFCTDNGITTTAYSPLTHGIRIDDKRLVEIGKEYKKSSVQILIKWSLQKGNIVIPKSTNNERIKENIDVFDFTIEQRHMEVLDALEEGFVTCWDPTTDP